MVGSNVGLVTKDSVMSDAQTSEKKLCVVPSDSAKVLFAVLMYTRPEPIVFVRALFMELQKVCPITAEYRYSKKLIKSATLPLKTYPFAFC